jgi:hypothetical protein
LGTKRENVPNMPALLAPAILTGHAAIARVSLLSFFTWKVVAGIGICGLISSMLLFGPVMADRAFATFSARVQKIAPATLLIGGVILVTGLVVGVLAMDLIGGFMAGSIIVLWIFKEY